MSEYTIVDEPRVSKSNYLIVNPIIILFAAIFVPLFISIPYLGRIWIPATWLVINSFLLGSSTRRKETLLAVVAVIIWFAIAFKSFFVYELISDNHNFKLWVPYIRILLQGIFFFFLLYIVSIQSTAYGIYQYLAKKD